jgi:twitching motility protein PilT
MNILHIDEMLRTVCAREASDLLLAIGGPPVMHLHGQMQPLATQVLGPADTLALMKCVTPERCQQELQEVGRTEFGFAFGDLARFCVAVSRQSGDIDLVLRRVPDHSSCG